MWCTWCQCHVLLPVPAHLSPSRDLSKFWGLQEAPAYTQYSLHPTQYSGSTFCLCSDAWEARWCFSRAVWRGCSCSWYASGCFTWTYSPASGGCPANIDCPPGWSLCRSSARSVWELVCVRHICLEWEISNRQHVAWQSKLWFLVNWHVFYWNFHIYPFTTANTVWLWTGVEYSAGCSERELGWSFEVTGCNTQTFPLQTVKTAPFS